MATPLPLSVENATDPTCDIAIWVRFLFFFLGINEGNYNFWDQEINLKGSRIALDFFLELLLLQNQKFWASERPYLKEKTKRCDTRRYKR